MVGTLEKYRAKLGVSGTQLMEKMLNMDPEGRPSCKECLLHPYFLEHAGTANTTSSTAVDTGANANAVSAHASCASIPTSTSIQSFSSLAQHAVPFRSRPNTREKHRSDTPASTVNTSQSSTSVASSDLSTARNDTANDSANDSDSDGNNDSDSDEGYYTPTSALPSDSGASTPRSDIANTNGNSDDLTSSSSDSSSMCSFSSASLSTEALVLRKNDVVCSRTAKPLALPTLFSRSNFANRTDEMKAMPSVLPVRRKEQEAEQREDREREKGREAEEGQLEREREKEREQEKEKELEEGTMREKLKFWRDANTGPSVIRLADKPKRPSTREAPPLRHPDLELIDFPDTPETRKSNLPPKRHPAAPAAKPSVTPPNPPPSRQPLFVRKPDPSTVVPPPAGSSLLSRHAPAIQPRTTLPYLLAGMSKGPPPTAPAAVPMGGEPVASTPPMSLFSVLDLAGGACGTADDALPEETTAATHVRAFVGTPPNVHRVGLGSRNGTANASRTFVKRQNLLRGTPHKLPKLRQKPSNPAQACLL
eukprot:TRINITY_DN3353_c0_g1_i3.p1 TRINITY_DN3353_c0_g1~~TRINITY_DN3353_c0_g1_i3.p1  ORF type:complete len:536 (-),score=114.39 TRINITY_DN3353_c0_g1_i3:117-1724(-)